MTYVDCKFLIVHGAQRVVRGGDKVKRYSKFCDVVKLDSDVRSQVENYGVCGVDCPGYTK